MLDSPLLRNPSTAKEGALAGGDQSCCFNRCAKTSACGGKCAYWKVKKTSDALILGFSILSALAVFMAIIMPILVDGLLDTGIADTLVVDSKDASGYDTFQSNTKDGDQVVHYGVYYFDVQNPDDILAGQKPKLLERGPYMYREYFYKFDIEWSKGGEHVSYYEWKYYVFDPENSSPGVDPSDNITQAYFTALTIQNILIPMEPQLQEAVNNGLDAYFLPQIAAATGLEKIKLQIAYTKAKNTVEENGVWPIIYKTLLCESYGLTPFMTRSAHDVYWGWFNDPMFSLLKPLAASMNQTITAAIPGIAANYTSMNDTMRRTNRDLVHTGKNDIKKISEFQLYQNTSLMWVCLLSTGGSDELEEWPTCPHFQEEWNASEAEKNGYVLPWETAWANRIDGTDGVTFGRVVTANNLQAFISDIYSTRFLGRQSTNDDFYSIPLTRYGLRDKDLENASVVPENAQFYQFGPKGLSNFTKAVGLPLFASKPHFLDGDSRLQEALIGMRPTRDIHDTILDVEENTGIVMRARKRLQVNNFLYTTELPRISERDSELFAQIIIKLICQGRPNCTDADALVHCLAHNVTWNINGGSVYLPYTWTDEYYDLNHDDSISIKEDVIDTQTFAQDFQLWSFVAAGILALLALTMYLTRNIVRYERRGYSEMVDDFEVTNYDNPKLEESKVF